MKIDKNIAFGNRVGVKKTRTYRSKYPFGEMAVGDSFFVASGEGAFVVSAAACSHGKRHNKRFATRAVEGGTRVWRIA
jgi:hypothetical protein